MYVFIDYIFRFSPINFDLSNTGLHTRFLHLSQRRDYPCGAKGIYLSRLLADIKKALAIAGYDSYS